MKNEHIPPNPYPVKPPPNMPAPRKESLEAENARLKAEVERLEHQVNYWRIEAETDNARWLRCLEDKERLTKAGDNLERVLTARSGSYEAGNASHEWQSAKKGGQS